MFDIAMKYKFKKITGIAVWIIIFSLSACKGDMLNNNDSAAIKKWISDGALIVDVRTPEEFKAGNYKNSINIPVDEIENKLKIFGDKDRLIIVYCRSGNRSGKAKKILERHGYEKVLNAGAFSKMPD
jgi:phage shock protein E